MQAPARGERYGRLVVLGESGYFTRRSGGRLRLYACLCDCGETTRVRAADLRSGNTQSCGCLRRERQAALLRTHGQSGSPTHVTWLHMIDRCCNPNADNYCYYGGRGVRVCARWRESFEAFLADMGERPEGMTLDRIEPDGDYEPSNCRWADALTQRHNRRAA